MESLEERRLLISSVPVLDVPPQNFANPEDTNYDGEVTPLDALLVINELNDPTSSGSPATSSKDVNGDGVVSPGDALYIINRLNSGNDRSSVAPEQRAEGLRKVLDSGFLPPNMSASQAHELLETLENGGHYEIGERYRNGQMININDEPDELGESVATAEGEATSASQQSLAPTSGNVLSDRDLERSVEQDDPFILLQSADDALTEHLHDPALWRVFSETPVGARPELVDRFVTRFSEQLADQLAEADTRARITQALTDALQNGDDTVASIIDEMQALQATLGNAHSQIAQMFANLDIEAIIEQLSVDLGTVAEAVLSHDHVTPSDHETIFADFLSREYLRTLDAFLP
jgi:hypothetical protein